MVSEVPDADPRVDVSYDDGDGNDDSAAAAPMELNATEEECELLKPRTIVSSSGGGGGGVAAAAAAWRVYCPPAYCNPTGFGRATDAPLQQTTLAHAADDTPARYVPARREKRVSSLHLAGDACGDGAATSAAAFAAAAAATSNELSSSRANNNGASRDGGRGGALGRALNRHLPLPPQDLSGATTPVAGTKRSGGDPGDTMLPSGGGSASRSTTATGGGAPTNRGGHERRELAAGAGAGSGAGVGAGLASVDDKSNSEEKEEEKEGGVNSDLDDAAAVNPQ